MKVGSLVEMIKNYSKEEVKRRKEFDTLLPVRGVIYTVRDIDCIGGRTGIRLEEIINPVVKHIDSTNEALFGIKYFREIQPPMEISIEDLIEEPLSV